jgi:hypothetical protein
MRKFNFSLAFIIVAIQLAGCRVTPSNPTEQDAIVIYQTVIRQIYQSDDTFGGTLVKPILYIIRTTNDAIGDPSIQQSNPVVLSDTIQQGIANALVNLPAAIIWVDGSDQVGLDPHTGFVSDQGVVITLGNIKYENSDKALISAGIYVASLAAGGKTYIIEKQDGVWTITGTTGVEWIS